MMLTAILPSIDYEINYSATYISIVLFIFCDFLIFGQSYLFEVYYAIKLSIGIGAILLTIGCIMIYFYHSNMMIFCLGSSVFGTSIGLLPPVILSEITNEENLQSKIIVYNNLNAISAATDPLIGEIAYNYNTNLLFISWIIMSLIFLVISFTYIFIGEEHSTMIGVKSKNIFTGLKEYQSLFVILILIAITYGTVLTYLPIYLEEVNSSICIYYLVFWTMYALVQIVPIKKETNITKTFILLMILIITSQSLIIFSSSLLIMTACAYIYGSAYGLFSN